MSASYNKINTFKRYKPDKSLEEKKSTIHKYLSHHYIQRRSVVFIVDTQFESVVHYEKAYSYVKQFFKSLDDDDYFGFISLGKANALDYSPLQQKQNNKMLQYKFIKMMKAREPELFL